MWCGLPTCARKRLRSKSPAEQQHAGRVVQQSHSAERERPPLRYISYAASVAIPSANW